MCTMHFSNFPKAFDKRRSLADSMSANQALFIALPYYDVEEGERRTIYVEFYAPDKNEHHFLRRAMYDFFALDTVRALGLRKLYVFSDGGPKHFKTARSLFYLLVEMKERCAGVHCAGFSLFHLGQQSTSSGRISPLTMARVCVILMPLS